MPFLLKLLFKAMVDFEYIRKNDLCTAFCHSQNTTGIPFHFSYLDQIGTVQ